MLRANMSNVKLNYCLLITIILIFIGQHHVNGGVFRGIPSDDICSYRVARFDSFGTNWCPYSNPFSTSYSQLETSPGYNQKYKLNYQCREGECVALIGVKTFSDSNFLYIVKAFQDGGLTLSQYDRSGANYPVIYLLNSDMSPNITHFDGLNAWSPIKNDNIFATIDVNYNLKVFINMNYNYTTTNFGINGFELQQFKLFRHVKNLKNFIVTLHRSIEDPAKYILQFNLISTNQVYQWPLKSNQNSVLKFDLSTQMIDIKNDSPMRIDQELFINNRYAFTRMLVTLYSTSEVRIYEFNENILIQPIDFTKPDILNTFYETSTTILYVTLVPETIRKPIDLLEYSFPKSQNIYLAIGTEAENEVLIHHVAEFADYTSINSDFTNTASRFTPFPCRVYQHYNFKSGECVYGEEKEIATSGKVIGISVRFSDVGQSENQVYYNDKGYLIYDNLATEADIYSSKTNAMTKLYTFFQVYWQESLFIITDTSNIDIISLTFFQANHDSGLFNSRNINTLKFPSPIVYLDHSENNQHLVVTTSRSILDISSHQRYVEVCKKLEKDPENIFLKSFATTCQSNPPPLLDENKFIYYANTCFPGTSCYNLKYRNITSNIGDGIYARGFLMKNCPAGSYCLHGLKVPCPSGLICNGQPAPCNSYLPTGSFTCYSEGLSTYQKCPISTSCSTTQTEPVFAPPNYFMNINYFSGRRTLKECKSGDYCNLGRFAYEEDTTHEYGDIRCPADTHCPTASVIEPIPCKFSNKSIDYCPMATVENKPCPAGNYCETPHTIASCDPQQFCPNGSLTYELCPKGYYCPTPSEKIICPSGHYCTPGSIEPRSCSWFLSNCPEGSSSDTMTAGGIFLFVLFIISLFSIGIIYKFLHALYLKSLKNKVYQSGYLLKKAKKRNDSYMATRSFINDEFTVDIGFNNLGLILRGSGKKVLDGVTGEIKHGQLTAVMGLSGCGKSTFITTLANRAYYGTSIGSIFVNGVEEPLSKYNRRIGFVPQEDIMLTTMTVEETLYFSARTRLDRRKSKGEIEAIVNDVLKVLRLEDIRHSIIGDSENRGISGGQRKRVNVGMELVASPVVLLLDEPTSGLDSASSKEVCEVLQIIASTGINVITVIHQPRYEIFNMFDNLLLLGKGGRTIYLGPVKRVEEYFKEEFKCEKPEGVNFADYLMDVSAGLDMNVDPKELPSHWENNKKKYDNSRKQSTSILDGGFGHQISMSNTKSVYEDPKLNYIMQFLMCLKRSFVQHLRSLQSIALDFALIFICASFLSLLFHNKVYIGPLPKNVYSQCPGELADVCKQPIEDPVASFAGLMSLAMALMGSMAALRVFGKEYLVFYRESQSGLGTFAYFWAKDISNLIINLLAPFVFLTIFYTTVAPTASVLEYYYALLLNYWVSFGLGYLVSVLVNPSNAQLTTVVIVFVINIFSGMTTPLPTLRDMYFPIKYFPDVSYLKYSHEQLYLNEIESYKHLYDLNTSLKNMGYSWDNIDTNPLVLLAFGFLFRILAFISLVCVKPSSLFKLVYFSSQNFVLERFRNLAKSLAKWRENRKLQAKANNHSLSLNTSESSESLSLMTN